MISKDVDLIAEAYISASQKSINPPNDTINARVLPPSADIEGEDPSVAVVAVPGGPEATADTEMCCGHDDEEQEEDWMTRSNLFSIFSNAKKVHNASVLGLELEPWAQQKIAVAAHDLEAVMKYVAYECASKGVEV